MLIVPACCLAWCRCSLHLHQATYYFAFATAFCVRSNSASLASVISSMVATMDLPVMAAISLSLRCASRVIRITECVLSMYALYTLYALLSIGK
jgi:hypothetical protein